MRYKVLVADDDMSISKEIGRWLQQGGFSVLNAYSGAEALEKVRKHRPDIVLMDILLGDADGAQLCKLLREEPATRQVPIILITASRIKEPDMVSGLRGGADDYLLKPLSPQLLLAKVEAVLRRSKTIGESGEILKRYGLVLNLSDRKVLLGKKEIRLTRKEFDLLAVLLRKNGAIVSPQDLLETVWGYELEDYNDPRTVHVHMSRLKKKLGKSFSSHIENVIGSGYRLD